MYKCDDCIALIPIKRSFSRVNAQMIAEITFINLATQRKTINYFQIEFANDVSGLCDMGNSFYTDDTCKASLQCELSCDPPALLCL